MAFVNLWTGLDTHHIDDNACYEALVSTPVIVLQAGHVGRKRGRTGTTGTHKIKVGSETHTYTLTEQHVTLVVRDAAAKYLKTSAPPGVPVFTFGADDVPHYKKDKAHDPVALVAIHCDGSPEAASRGYSFGYPDNKMSRTLRDTLADAYEEVQGELWKAQAIPQGGKDNHTPDLKGYYVWSTLPKDSPAVLIELGFLSNPDDFQVIYDHLDSIGYALALGISRFLRSQMSFHYAILSEFNDPPRESLPDGGDPPLVCT